MAEEAIERSNPAAAAAGEPTRGQARRSLVSALSEARARATAHGAVAKQAAAAGLPSVSNQRCRRHCLAIRHDPLHTPEGMDAQSTSRLADISRRADDAGAACRREGDAGEERRVEVGRSRPRGRSAGRAVAIPTYVAAPIYAGRALASAGTGRGVTPIFEPGDDLEEPPLVEEAALQPTCSRPSHVSPDGRIRAPDQSRSFGGHAEHRFSIALNSVRGRAGLYENQALACWAQRSNGFPASAETSRGEELAEEVVVAVLLRSRSGPRNEFDQGVSSRFARASRSVTVSQDVAQKWPSTEVRSRNASSRRGAGQHLRAQIVDDVLRERLDELRARRRPAADCQRREGDQLPTSVSSRSVPTAEPGGRAGH